MTIRLGVALTAQHVRPLPTSQGIVLVEKVRNAIMQTVRTHTECETPPPKTREMLMSLFQWEWSANESYSLRFSRKYIMLVIDRAGNAF